MLSTIKIMDEEYEVEECEIGTAELKDEVLTVPIRVKTKPKSEKIKIDIKVKKEKKC